MPLAETDIALAGADVGGSNSTSAAWTADREKASDAQASRTPVESSPARPSVVRQSVKLVLMLAGVAGLVASVLWAGVGQVLREFSAAGWILVPAAALHVVPILLDAAAWRTLTPPRRPSLLVFAVARWVREGVNALVPAAQIGGEVVGARLLSRARESQANAGVVVSIDLATEFLSMVLVGLVGAFALYELASPADKGRAALVSAAIAPAAALALIVLFAQHTWLLDRAGRLARSRWPGAEKHLAKVREILLRVWSRPKQMALAVGLHCLGWVAGACETWMMLYLLGHHLAFWRAFALETTSEVIRSFGFAIPGLLGAQEGSLILVGALVGVPPAGAVALSLFRRARDIGLGLPALLVWYSGEYARRGRDVCASLPDASDPSALATQDGAGTRGSSLTSSR